MPPAEELICVDTVLGVVPTGPTTVRTGDLANHNPSTLQAALGLPAPPSLVFAKGGVSPDDDGGGTFIWGPGGGTDNGGTFIVPGGNVSSVGAGWRRIWRDRMDVQWFGAPAVYNASLSTHYAIQLAVDAAVTETKGGVYTSPPVYFPPGLYSLAQPVDAKTANLVGDNTNIAPSGSGTPAALLMREYVEGWIEGFNFLNGEVQLLIYARDPKQLVNRQQLRISNCKFSAMTEWAIVMRDYIGMHLVVEDFTFVGPRFFRGAVENLTIRAGFLEWIAPDIDLVDPQKNYCFAINYSNAVLEDLVGAPTGAATDDVAWILLNGGAPTDEPDPPDPVPRSRLLCRHVRFGGEGGGTSIVHLISRDHLGEIKRMSSTTIEFLSCAMYAALKHWMKIDDVFPSTIRVRGLSVGLDNSLGIYVSPAAAASLIGRHAVEVDLEALASGAPGGSFREDLGGGRFRVLNNTLMTQFDDRLYEATSDLPGGNYFVTGQYSPESFTTLFDGTTQTPYYDVFAGGRALPIFQAPSTGKGHVWYQSPAWGGGVAAGTYCFSVYVRSINGQSTVRFIYKGRLLRQMRIGQSGVSLQRAFASFYHDGSGDNLIVQIDEIDPNGAVSFGFFCVSSGTTPAPYTFPGNRWSGLVLPEAYYGVARPLAPADGTYKQGDIVWNTAPSPGGFVGFVCVASGTPGIWKGFGAIEL